MGWILLWEVILQELVDPSADSYVGRIERLIGLRSSHPEPTGDAHPRLVGG